MHQSNPFASTDENDRASSERLKKQKTYAALIISFFNLLKIDIYQIRKNRKGTDLN